MLTTLEAATFYLDRGYNVVPALKDDKKPAINWLPYQTQRVPIELLTEYFTKHPDANLAIITGKISGITVFDIDVPKPDASAEEKAKASEEIDALLKQLPTTYTVKSPSGGLHLYFHYSPYFKSNAKRIHPWLDIRNDGGVVIAPPSTRNNVPYSIHTTAPLAHIPKHFVDLAYTQSHSPALKQADRLRALAGVPEGARDNTAASVFGGILKYAIHTLDNYDVAARICFEFIECWNEHKNPKPLPPKQMQKIFQSITKTHHASLTEQLRRRDQNLPRLASENRSADASH